MRINFWLCMVLAVVLMAVGCETGGHGDDECLTSTPCMDSSDCDSGQHCNTALATPMCQVLYCGQDGSECSEDELCAGRNCDDGICVEDACVPACGTSECGMDPVCGTQSCGTCDDGHTCKSGKCVEDACVPACGMSECGMDPVCGTQSCGTCDDGHTCKSGKCVEDACVPACGMSECGMDPVCGTQICGSCSPGSGCLLGECVETGEMKLVASGSFWMGCNDGVDTQCSDDEKPYHKVTLSAYYMDMTEVTQSEYKKCIDAGECDTPTCDWNPTGTPNRPVVCVNWTQAGEYCAWAGKRLPTEAEWEKAARGTDGRKYPWGNEDATCEYAVMYDGTDDGCGTNSTWDVCSKSPAGDSPYGLCDMSGNVWEWVSDWYDSGYYTNSPASNPTGPVSGSNRVVRGGGCDDVDDLLRASLRGAGNPSVDDAVLGFRCARSQ